MNHSFEYIDLILLAMIAGFIFLRLRGILGRRTGHKENLDAKFSSNFQAEKILKEKLKQFNFDEKEKNDFLKGAQIAYERIITDFASGNLKNIKSLLSKKVFDQFNEALKERKKNGHISKTIFIGINSVLIKEHQQINNILEVTVDFISEIISCVKDDNNKIISGDPEKSKKVFDAWKFSKDSRSNNPNWLLTDTQI
jgi:predicted lipid-binding transport protein (Tim44 family)